MKTADACVGMAGRVTHVRMTSMNVLKAPIAVSNCVAIHEAAICVTVRMDTVSAVTSCLVSVIIPHAFHLVEMAVFASKASVDVVLVGVGHHAQSTSTNALHRHINVSRHVAIRKAATCATVDMGIASIETAGGA